MAIMQNDELFPSFARFAEQSGLAARAKGNLAAKLPRILGQGTTKAVGLPLPPAPIERRMELATLSLDTDIPRDVAAEIEAAKTEIARVRKDLTREEARRRLVLDAFSRIAQPTGTKDGKHFAGRLILSANKNGLEWSWSVTPYYSIIKRIPPDADYIVAAFEAGNEILGNLAMQPAQFESCLDLAWTIARHFAKSEDVPVLDVMKMFNVAAQDAKFWQSPQRQYFKDLPEAAFVSNLLAWRAHAGSGALSYEFVPATLHQAHGTMTKVFYLPMNPEGTDVRPMMYLRRRNAAAR